jgi:hypothetical protein
VTDFSGLPRARCRSCGATIHWVTTAVGGRAMPIDVKPHPDGNVFRQANGLAAVAANPPGDAVRYVSHFTTCPHASEHRARR